MSDRVYIYDSTLRDGAQTQGVDFTATYHADLDEWFGDHLGTLDFHLIGNHLDSIRTTPLPGEKPIEAANTIAGGVDATPTPFWQANLDENPNSVPICGSRDGRIWWADLV